MSLTAPNQMELKRGKKEWEKKKGKKTSNFTYADNDN
jgi:hypothetical protein